jgi:xanthine/uracil/vitamin C permease (AzgA family)
MATLAIQNRPVLDAVRSVLRDPREACAALSVAVPSTPIIVANVTKVADQVAQNAPSMAHTGDNIYPGLGAVIALIGLAAVAIVVRH